MHKRTIGELVDSSLLACPSCKGSLKGMKCQKCSRKYSYVNGKPAFIKQQIHSSEKLLDFFIARAKWIIPSPSFSFMSGRNISDLKKKLPRKATILVVGGGRLRYSKAMQSLKEHTLINLEIVDGPIVDVIADAHELPFRDGCFDAVISQAVLEHVKYPGRIVSEMHRVLKKGGIIYSEIPFIQGVHGRPYDFQRYTNEGIDVLFEGFQKDRSGILLGPTGSLIWILREYISIILSFNVKYLYYFFNLVFGWLFWPFKFLDYVLIHQRYSQNIAGAFYFLGRK